MIENLKINKKTKIAIIGMGYVGLPLAIKLAKKITITGYDIDKKKILNLKNYIDITNEVDFNEIKNAKKLKFTSNENSLKKNKIFIITVPTPVNINNKPDLCNIIAATKLVAKYLSKSSIVIYESTVYPGLTEEICKPILESKSKLIFNKDFYIGYSPERINPGDKKHSVDKIFKVISASDNKILKTIKKIYSLVTKKIFIASSIKVAEAAKIIENTQRDINIALMNELSKIFYKMNINTKEVLEAAKTKWNFGDYEPGLVGGHCIGVDPYYLTHKSIKLGYKPTIILSGRKINDGMPKYIFDKIKLLINKKFKKKKIKILFLGLTFKENCPDTRNSKSIELLKLMLNIYKKKIISFDPYVKKNKENKKLNIVNNLPNIKFFDVVILTVKHNFFKKNKKKILNNLNKHSLLIDIKNQFNDNRNHFSL